MPVSVSFNNQNNNPSASSAVGGLSMIDSTAAGLVPEGANFVYLSPESLMAYIEGQLQSLDDKIFNHMKEVEGRRKAADALGEVSAILKQCEKSAEGKYLENLKLKAWGTSEIYINGKPTGVVHSNSPAGKKLLQAKCAGGAEIKQIEPKDDEAMAQYQAVVSQFYNAAEKLKAQGYNDLSKKCEDIAKALEAGNVPSADAVAGLITEVESTMTSLSSSSQMTMIQLQELMQDRSRTVMWVTNAMASMNEASRKIIDNTR